MDFEIYLYCQGGQSLFPNNMQMEPFYQIMNNHFRLRAEFSFSGTGSAAFCMQLIINLKNYHFSEPCLHYLLSVIKVFISQVINEDNPSTLIVL